AACRMLGPQSSRNVAPSTSDRYALWKRPPAPNASPEPSTVIRMTRCAARLARVERSACRGARVAGWPLAPRRASIPIASTFTRARDPWPEVICRPSRLGARLGPRISRRLAWGRRLLCGEGTILRLEIVEHLLHALGTRRDVFQRPCQRIAL